MVQIAKLVADLFLNTARFEQGADRAAAKTSLLKKKIQSDLNGVANSFSGLTGRILGIEGALGGLVGGGSLVLFSAKALEAADRVDKMADRLGLTTTEIQRYTYAAGLAGVENGELEKAFTFLNNKIADGKLPYKNTSEAITSIAERMKNARTNIDRARIASEAFGDKLGSKLIPFFQQGADGIKLLGDEAERLGVVLDEKTIRNAAQFKDQLESLALVLTRNFQSGLLEGFVGNSQDIRDIYTDPDFINGVRTLGELFGKVAGALTQAVKGFNYATEGLAAFGIEVGKLSGWIDPDTADIAMEDLAMRKNAPPANPLPSINVSRDSSGRTAGSFEEAQKRAKAIKDINDGLTQELELTQLKVANFGLEDKALQSIIFAKKTELDLAKQGITLSESEKETLRSKLELLNQEAMQLDKLEEQKKLQDEADRDRKQAIQQLGFAFSSAFEDAILSGEKLSDVLRGLAQDVLKLILRMQVTEPLARSITGSFGGGAGGAGGGFDLLGTLGSFLPSFDVGSWNVPKDMTANIHKGEMIVPAAQAGAMRSGSMGNTYVIDARGTDATVIRRLEETMLRLAGPGVIENRVSNAQRRGML